MDFPALWRRVGELEGTVFQTERGEEFRYRFRRTYVVVSAGNLSIPRTNFERIFRRRTAGESVGAPAVQGQRYITAILSDPRMG